MLITVSVIKIHTSTMTSPGMEFSSMTTEYSLWSRAGTTSLTSLTVISTVAVVLNALGLPEGTQHYMCANGICS